MANVSAYEENAYFSQQPFLDETLSTILIAVFSSLTLLFTVPAIFLNLINIYVFSGHGLLDGVTICFLYLSVVDFISMLDLSALSFFQLASSFGGAWTINFSAFTYACSLIYTVANDMAAATTTYIALQRGLCVALPFLTRYLFNRTKSIIVLVAISLLTLVCWMPRTFSFQLIPMPHPADNTTIYLSIEHNSIQAVAYAFYVLFSKVTLAFTEYVIMVVCAVLIARGMRSSMQLKAKSVRGKEDASSGKNAEKEPSGKDEYLTSKDDQAKLGTKDSKKETKEAMVIKQTFIVVIIHIICITPAIASSTTLHFHPTVGNGYRFRSLTFTIFTGMYILHGINAFSNFFIYMQFNSKFRNVFYSAFSRTAAKKA